MIILELKVGKVKMVLMMVDKGVKIMNGVISLMNKLK